MVAPQGLGEVHSLSRNVVNFSHLNQTADTYRDIRKTRLLVPIRGISPLSRRLEKVQTSSCLHSTGEETGVL